MTEPVSTARPLAGVRVLDLTNVLAGPFCCHQLAHLGAEVIKIEAPGRGDLARQLGADRALNERLMGVSFLAQNAGKKSVTLNLKKPAGKDLLRRLARNADVLVENFRPGVMARLELDYPRLRALNAGLIYCAISGFGQDGPMRDLPAYDQIVQGLSGVMSITGDAAAGTGPYRVGYPLCDTIGGLTAAMAVSAALAGRGTRADGSGTFIDVSMLEATLATMGWAVSDWLIAAVRPGAYGNENVTAAPSGTFRTATGLLNISANKQEQWQQLCQHLGRYDLLADPAYRTRDDRKAHRAALKIELETALIRRPSADWARELNARGVPAGEVLSVPEALALAQVAERGLIGAFADVPGVERGVRVVRPGIKLNGAAPRVESPPPQLGQDNAEVFGALGLDTAQLAALHEAGVI